MDVLKIIVIDDEKDVGQLMKKALEQTGLYTVLTAHDGIVGEQLCRVEKPDLIFLDYVLPGMKGDEIIQSLKSDPATKHIPIVLMSGLGEMSYIEEKDQWKWAPNTKIVQSRGELPEVLKRPNASEEAAEQLGVTVYLRKPFSKKALLEVASEILERKGEEPPQDNPPGEGA